MHFLMTSTIREHERTFQIAKCLSQLSLSSPGLECVSWYRVSTMFIESVFNNLVYQSCRMISKEDIIFNFFTINQTTAGDSRNYVYVF